MVYRRGYVYVFTTDLYKKKTIYKIGRTKSIKKRLQTINSSRIFTDRMFCVFKIYSKDCYSLEKETHHILSLYNINGEFFKYPLKKIIYNLKSLSNKLQ